MNNRIFLGDEGTKMLMKKDGGIKASVMSKTRVINNIADVVSYYNELKEVKVGEKDRKKKIKNILADMWAEYKVKNF